MKKIIAAVLTFVMTVGVLMGGIGTQATRVEAKSTATKSYGVFLGADGDSNWKKMMSYKTVVIDAAYFSKAEIKRFHDNGQTVYSYLNVGSLENFRSYYKQFEDILLDEYDGWPEERWVDVSQEEWQDYVVNTMAKTLSDKGADGFFLDNFDVYYHYPKKNIYQGLLNILQDLQDTYQKPSIINGGDEFLTKAIKNNDAENLVAGMNQEDVFTSVDLDTKTYTAQTASDSKYYQAYLKLCKKAGIQGYLLEYKANKTQLKKIKAFCKKNNFLYYNAPTVELKAD